VDGSLGVDTAGWSLIVVRIEGEEIVTCICTASSVSTTRFSTTSSTSPPFFPSAFPLHRVNNPRKLNALKPLQRRLKPSQTPTNGNTTIINPN
jgi:hypothetical protein